MADGSHPNEESSSERLRGHEWFEIRERVLDRDGHECRNCRSSSNLVAHHIVPVETTGTNRITNLATLCRECHRHAHNERIRESSRGYSTDASRYLLTAEELRKILQTATHPLDRAIIMALAKTGIGAGELCNLAMDDVQLPDVSQRRIGDDVPAQIPFLQIRYGGELPYSNRRERKGTTFVPIDEELAHGLKKWLAVRPDPRDGNPLFTSTREQWGLRISPHMIRGILKTHGEALGLYEEDSEMNNLTPYALRYFFEERFAGQPPVREYLLGRRTNIDWSLEEIATHYRQHGFEFGLGPLA